MKIQSLLTSGYTRTPLWQYFVIVIGLLTAAPSCDPIKNGLKKPRAERPNILVILADDLGINDIGANGNQNVLAPNMDRLADSGFRFTRFYTAGPLQYQVIIIL